MHILSAFCAFYHDNAHRLKLKGRVFESLPAEAGVRQGCPLSPLLIVICVDLILKRLARLLPDCSVRAFADGSGLVMLDFFCSAPLLMHTFQEFSRISGLSLIMPKTVLVLLWPSYDQSFRSLLRNDLPHWFLVSVQPCARYLGFVVGPGRMTAGWDNAVDRIEARTSQWAALRLGLNWASFACNFFAISVLGFLGQLNTSLQLALDAEVRSL